MSEKFLEDEAFCRKTLERIPLSSYRRSGCKIQRSCFTGAELVDYLIDENIVSDVAEAICMGQELLFLKKIEVVLVWNEESKTSTDMKSTALMSRRIAPTSSYNPSSNDPRFADDRSLYRLGMISRQVTEWLASSQDIEEEIKAAEMNKVIQEKLKIMEGASFGLFDNRNSFRRYCADLVTAPAFDNFIIFLILISIILIAAEHPSGDGSDVRLKIFYILDIIFTSLFTLEMLIKMVAHGVFQTKRSYISSGWNRLDFAIVVISLLSLSVKSLNLEYLKVLRVMRALRPLRLVSHSPELKAAFSAIVMITKPLMSFALVVNVLLLTFSILMTSLYRDKLKFCHALSDDLSVDVNEYRYELSRVDCTGTIVSESNSTVTLEWKSVDSNFDSVSNSFLTLFEMITMDDWPQIMYPAMDINADDEHPIMNKSQYNAIVFIVFIIIGAFCIGNVLVGIVVNKFTRSIREGKDDAFLSDEQQKWLDSMKIAITAKPLRRLPLPEKDELYGLKRPIYQIVIDKRFQYVMDVVIVLNMFSMTINYFGEPSDYARGTFILEVVFSSLFFVEISLRYFAVKPFEFVKVTWNVLDSLIVAGSIAGLFLTSSKINVSIFRLFRVGRILRLVRKSKNLTILVKTLQLSIFSLVNIGLLLLLSVFIFAIIGMHLFWDVDIDGRVFTSHQHFKSLGTTMLLLFRCITGEGWTSIMHYLMDAGFKEISPIYFIFFLTVNQSVLLSLFVAIILNNFATALQYDPDKVNKRNLEDFINVWAELHVELGSDDKEYYLPSYALVSLLHRTEAPLGVKNVTQDMLNVDENTDKTEFIVNLIHTLELKEDSTGKINFIDTVAALIRNLHRQNRNSESQQPEAESMMSEDQKHELQICLTKMCKTRLVSKIREGTKNMSFFDIDLAVMITNAIVIQTCWRTYMSKREFVKLWKKSRRKLPTGHSLSRLLSGLEESNEGDHKNSRPSLLGKMFRRDSKELVAVPNTSPNRRGSLRKMMRESFSSLGSSFSRSGGRCEDNISLERMTSVSTFQSVDISSPIKDETLMVTLLEEKRKSGLLAPSNHEIVADYVVTQDLSFVQDVLTNSPQMEVPLYLSRPPVPLSSPGLCTPPSSPSVPTPSPPRPIHGPRLFEKKFLMSQELPHVSSQREILFERSMLSRSSYSITEVVDESEAGSDEDLIKKNTFDTIESNSSSNDSDDVVLCVDDLDQDIFSTAMDWSTGSHSGSYTSSRSSSIRRSSSISLLPHVSSARSLEATPIPLPPKPPLPEGPSSETREEKNAVEMAPNSRNVKGSLSNIFGFVDDETVVNKGSGEKLMPANETEPNLIINNDRNSNALTTMLNIKSDDHDMETSHNSDGIFEKERSEAEKASKKAEKARAKVARAKAREEKKRLKREKAETSTGGSLVLNDRGAAHHSQDGLPSDNGSEINDTTRKKFNQDLSNVDSVESVSKDYDDPTSRLIKAAKEEKNALDVGRGEKLTLTKVREAIGRDESRVDGVQSSSEEDDDLTPLLMEVVEDKKKSDAVDEELFTKISPQVKAGTTEEESDVDVAESESDSDDDLIARLIEAAKEENSNLGVDIGGELLSTKVNKAIDRDDDGAESSSDEDVDPIARLIKAAEDEKNLLNVHEGEQLSSVNVRDESRVHGVESSSEEDDDESIALLIKAAEDEKYAGNVHKELLKDFLPPVKEELTEEESDVDVAESVSDGDDDPITRLVKAAQQEKYALEIEKGKETSTTIDNEVIDRDESYVDGVKSTSEKDDEPLTRLIEAATDEKKSGDSKVEQWKEILPRVKEQTTEEESDIDVTEPVSEDDDDPITRLIKAAEDEKKSVDINKELLNESFPRAKERNTVEESDAESVNEEDDDPITRLIKAAEDDNTRVLDQQHVQRREGDIDNTTENKRHFLAESGKNVDNATNLILSPTKKGAHQITGTMSNGPTSHSNEDPSVSDNSQNVEHDFGGTDHKNPLNEELLQNSEGISEKERIKADKARKKADKARAKEARAKAREEKKRKKREKAEKMAAVENENGAARYLANGMPSHNSTEMAAAGINCEYGDTNDISERTLPESREKVEDWRMQDNANKVKSEKTCSASAHLLKAPKEVRMTVEDGEYYKIATAHELSTTKKGGLQITGTMSNSSISLNHEDLSVTDKGQNIGHEGGGTLHPEEILQNSEGICERERTKAEKARKKAEKTRAKEARAKAREEKKRKKRDKAEKSTGGSLVQNDDDVALSSENGLPLDNSTEIDDQINRMIRFKAETEQLRAHSGLGGDKGLEIDSKLYRTYKLSGGDRDRSQILDDRRMTTVEKSTARTEKVKSKEEKVRGKGKTKRQPEENTTIKEISNDSKSIHVSDGVKSNFTSVGVASEFGQDNGMSEEAVNDRIQVDLDIDEESPSVINDGTDLATLSIEDEIPSSLLVEMENIASKLMLEKLADPSSANQKSKLHGDVISVASENASNNMDDTSTSPTQKSNSGETAKLSVRKLSEQHLNSFNNQSRSSMNREEIPRTSIKCKMEIFQNASSPASTKSIDSFRSPTTPSKLSKARLMRFESSSNKSTPGGK